MPRTGFEPARVASLPPQSSASANSATWARVSRRIIRWTAGLSRELYHAPGRCCTISRRFGGDGKLNEQFAGENHAKAEKYGFAADVSEGGGSGGVCGEGADDHRR